MTCDACPFSLSEKAEQGINWGCLPAPYDILQMKKENNQNWACHEDKTEKRLCAGYVSYCREIGIDYKTGETVGLSVW